MRTTICLLLGSATAALAAPAWADAPPKVTADARPSAVTVYPDQASVIRVASVAIPAGDSTVIVGGVPAGLVADSVNARGRAVGAVTIGSVETRQVTFDRNALAERGAAVQARLRALDDRIAGVDVTLASLAAERRLLESLAAAAAEGRPPAPPTGSEPKARLADDPAAWKAARIAVREGTAEIGEATRTATAARTELQRDKAALEAEQGATTRPATGTLEIAIEVNATTATTLELSVTYQVRGASWHPVYEARLDSASGKLAIREEAAVVQRTGEDWSNVAVTLSTARPSAGIQPPVLQPWRIALYEPPVAQSRPSAPMMAMAPSPAPAAAARAKIANAQDAVVDAEPIPVEAQQAAATMSATGLSVEYVIPGRSGIPSDGAEHRVRIADMDAAAKLAATTVPRLDPHAYLQARFSSPTPVPMLPGPVALYLDATFVGRTQSSLVRPGEPITWPFGPDDRVKVTFENQEQKKSTEGWSIIGSKKVTQAAQGLVTVRNFHDQPIEITAFDQAPVSGDAELIVTTTADPQPTTKDVDDKPGVLAWIATYAPKEERRIRFGWQITAPEDRPVTGLR
jgi:uncharacterized protein (TIGR02231 family)